MVLTIEPGCYFVDHLIDSALADPELSRFVVRDRIEEFRGFGGVRIEDDIIITETGLEMMSIVPREVVVMLQINPFTVTPITVVLTYSGYFDTSCKSYEVSL